MILRRQNDSTPTDQAKLVRVGDKVRLEKHSEKDEAAFVRWYTDAEIAHVLRHDLRPLTTYQARGYFTSIVLPNSGQGTAWAIHENESGRLVGTTAVTQVNEKDGECLFRIVIGDKSAWGQGFGTDATRLVVAEVFEKLKLHTVNLEVFAHNERALRSYLRVGFEETGRTVEWARDTRLDVIAMKLTRETWDGTYATPTSGH